MTDTDTPHILPELFLERLSHIVPESHYSGILETFDSPSVTAFRINTLMGDPKDIQKQLFSLPIKIHRVKWLKEAFYIEPHSRDQLMEASLYRDGFLYIQNLSSMVPPLILAPKPGDRVLDLAAAPGGKTLQIASMMGSEGEVTAVEVVRNRYYKMRDNLQSHGAGWVNMLCMNGENIWKRFEGYFNKVLLDAPCSTEARFKTYDPGTCKYWSLRKIKEMVRKQSRLLFSGIMSLRVGGVLVYSTCSFAPEENEGVIRRMLEKFGQSIEIEPVTWPVKNIQPGLKQWKSKSLNPQLEKALRILPTDSMEGFFVCKISKKDSTIAR